NVAIEGTPRSLHPIVRDDIYRIAGEAMRNAFRHAHARRIEVEIRYDAAQLQVRVGDDGKGIELAVVDEPQPGHFGLPGMRGRAGRGGAGGGGGGLEGGRGGGLGTGVALKIPAVAAYATPRPRGRLRPFAARRTRARDRDLAL